MAKNRTIFLDEYKNHNGQCEYGEDGILSYIFKCLNQKCLFSIEFGAGDGIRNSITYPFRKKGGISLLMDGAVMMDEYYDGRELDREIKTSAGVSEFDILNSKAGVKKEFITRENINELFEKYNVPDNVDLLVIDIDGNDYHIWKEIKIKPTVVMIEFNQFIDPNVNAIVKYKSDFKTKIKDRYTSASCKSMFLLGKAKGYTLLEVIADNMIFIKNEYANKIFVSKEFQDDYISLLIKNFIKKENRVNLTKGFLHKKYKKIRNRKLSFLKKILFKMGIIKTFIPSWQNHKKFGIWTE